MQVRVSHSFAKNWLIWHCYCTAQARHHPPHATFPQACAINPPGLPHLPNRRVQTENLPATHCRLRGGADHAPRPASSHLGRVGRMYPAVHWIDLPLLVRSTWEPPPHPCFGRTSTARTLNNSKNVPRQPEKRSPPARETSPVSPRNAPRQPVPAPPARQT